MQKRLQYETPRVEAMELLVEGGYAISTPSYGDGGSMELSLDPGPRDYLFLDEDNY
jgi:hypothetical protein